MPTPGQQLTEAERCAPAGKFRVVRNHAVGEPGKSESNIFFVRDCDVQEEARRAVHNAFSSERNPRVGYQAYDDRGQSVLED